MPAKAPLTTAQTPGGFPAPWALQLQFPLVCCRPVCTTASDNLSLPPSLTPPLWNASNGGASLVWIPTRGAGVLLRGRTLKTSPGPPRSPQPPPCNTGEQTLSCCSQRLQPRPQQQALQPHLHPVPSGRHGAGVLPAAQCPFTPSSPCCVSHRPLEGPGRGDTADGLPHPLPHLLLGLGTPRSTPAHGTGLPPAWPTKGLASREGCVIRALPTVGFFRETCVPSSPPEGGVWTFVPSSPSVAG